MIFGLKQFSIFDNILFANRAVRFQLLIFHLLLALLFLLVDNFQLVINYCNFIESRVRLRFKHDRVLVSFVLSVHSPDVESIGASSYRESLSYG